jgi:hypothetical protein
MLIQRARALFATIMLVYTFGAAATGAAAPAPTAAMMAPIRRLVAFVNTGSSIPGGTYAAAATITDEFAPFHWTSGDVGQLWSAGFTAYNAGAKITKPHIVLGAPTEYAAAASNAYVVFPATFTPLLNGKPFTETGYWTFVLVKSGALWHVASQTWSGVTFR